MRAIAAAALLAALSLPMSVGHAKVQEPAPPPPPEIPVPEGDEDPGYWQEVICKASPRPASRLRSRAQVCHTRQDWQLLEDEAAEETRRLQDGGRYGGNDDPLTRRPGGADPGRNQSPGGT